MSSLDRCEAALREFALSFPEAQEAFPWGERVIKVRAKSFLFMRNDADELRVGVKLRESQVAALALPFVEPTHYGMGKWGWVTASFGPKDELPEELLREWTEESYRLVAPKRLVAQLPNRR